jgi:hypothetical protein
MAFRQLFTHILPQHSGGYIFLITISYFLFFQHFASAYSIDILTEMEPKSTEDASSQHFLQQKPLSSFSNEDEWDEDEGDRSEELANKTFKSAQEEFSRDLRVSDEPLMTIYVSAIHGNDSNNGTEAFPVASLNASLALLPASYIYDSDFYNEEDWERMGTEEEEKKGDEEGEAAFFLPMVVIVIREGNYTGVLNQNLRLPTGLSFNFTAPSGPDLTIFDAEGKPVYFFERLAGPSSFSSSTFRSDTPFATLKKSTKAIFDGLSFRNAGGGAIIWLDKSSTLLLLNTSFINNVLTLPQRVTGSQIGYGGAVTFCTRRIAITQSLFLDNGITSNLSSSSFPNLGSGGLSGSTISLYLRQCIFQSNYGLLSPSPSSSVIYSPAGALFLSMVKGTVEGSSFVNNSGEWGGFHFWASSRGTFGTNSILYLRNVESTNNHGIKSRLSLWIPAVFQDCTFREDGNFFFSPVSLSVLLTCDSYRESTTIRTESVILPVRYWHFSPLFTSKHHRKMVLSLKYTLSAPLVDQWHSE